MLREILLALQPLTGDNRHATKEFPKPSPINRVGSLLRLDREILQCLANMSPQLGNRSISEARFWVT